jgi:hypothetical protein
MQQGCVWSPQQSSNINCLGSPCFIFIEIMEGLSFQIETLRTPYESVLLGSQVYHLKGQPTSVSLSLDIKECLGHCVFPSGHPSKY